MIFSLVPTLLRGNAYEFAEAIGGEGGQDIARGLAMELLYRHGGLSQREIDELMGIDYSSVSAGRKRFRTLAEQDKEYKKLVIRISVRADKGEAAIIIRAHDIPELHDRLIAATAKYLELSIITNDPLSVD